MSRAPASPPEPQTKDYTAELLAQGRAPADVSVEQFKWWGSDRETKPAQMPGSTGSA